MALNKEDREFILKVVSSVDKLRKDIEPRLSKVEKALGTEEKILSPIQFSKKPQSPKKGATFSEDIPFGDIDEEGESIQITFMKGEDNMEKHQILVQSLYATLKELCEKNGIEQLLIRLKD